jgi:formylglycine-generating enzyme required for sulfatase activity
MNRLMNCLRKRRRSFAVAAWGVAAATAVLSAQTSRPDVADMSLIPPGTYWMGRSTFFMVDAVGYFERDRQDDYPAHKVDLPAFYIDKYEVTNEDYARLLAAKQQVKAPWHWAAGKIPRSQERFPVYNVTWDEATIYCQWAGKRLPTEAEWEKAARGGLERKKFVWGDHGGGAVVFEGAVVPGSEGGDAAPMARTSSESPVAVGSYAPNGYGLYDMAGNVWEWVNDWYERNYYSISPALNPRGPEKGVYKVMRGGGWSDSDDRWMMPSFRNYTDPVQRAMTIGFRCARSAE